MRDGARELVAAARLFFRHANAFHRRRVLPSEVRILVVDQEVSTPRDHVFERLVALSALAVQQFGDRGRILCRDSTPSERTLVVVDLDAIELDRAQQRFERERYETVLPGGANHHDVGIDRIAHQALGEAVCIDGLQIAVANDIGNRRNALVRAQIGVALTHEIARRHLGCVQERAGVVVLIGD